jgi:hypothetical protein
LWKQSAHAKLLQRPPPQNISLKQAALLRDTGQEIDNLMTAFEKAAPTWRVLLNHSSAHTGVAFLNAVLAARPVATLSQLLVWLQQGPALLRLPELAAELDSAAVGGAAAATVGSTISSSSSSGGGSVSGYSRLWRFCTSGMLGHALSVVDSCLAVLLCQLNQHLRY